MWTACRVLGPQTCAYIYPDKLGLQNTPILINNQENFRLKRTNTCENVTQAVDLENSTKPSITLLSLKVKWSKNVRIVYNPNVLSMCRASLTFQWHTKCRGWTISLHRVALSANVSRSDCAPLRAKRIRSALRSRHSEKSGLRSNVVGQMDRKQSQEASKMKISSQFIAALYAD